MNEYRLIIVRETPHHIYFNLFVNGSLCNIQGFLCLENEAFTRLFKDLFRSSKGQCIRAYCQNPPTEFFP